MSGETGSNEALAPPEEIEAPERAEDEAPAEEANNGTAAATEAADDSESGSDNAAAPAAAAPRGRGRPAKSGVAKVAKPVVKKATNGRGRPPKDGSPKKPAAPKAPPREPERKSERARKQTRYVDEDSGDEEKVKKAPAAKKAAEGGKRKVGRPSKKAK